LPRPDRLLIVAGTATDVGKTWIASRLLGSLSATSVSVAARKPVQSFAPDDHHTDADVLGAASGEEPTVVCPAHRWYERPLAPPMAADALGRPTPRMNDLVDELRWPSGTGLGLVETAGGVRSPLAIDGDTVALAAVLWPDVVVLVAHAGLGTIHDVRLSAGALRPWPVVVVLNRFDPHDDLHRRNLAWLTEVDGLDVVTDAGVLARRHPHWCRPRP
jgi:dethiobiotin synthetase